MYRFLLVTALTIPLAVSATGCIIADGDSSLTIANDSSYVIEEVYLAEVNAPTWGPQLLPQPLFPGDDIVIESIDCGTYDALVVDETGVECELSGLDLCFDDDIWVIDDFTLDVCAFGG